MDIGQVQLGADLVAKAKLEQGELVVELRFAAEGLADQLIDVVEKAIPGDQTGIAAAAKIALKQILG